MHTNVFAFSEMLANSDKPYLEFLRVPSLSAGIYVLDTGRRIRRRCITTTRVIT